MWQQTIILGYLGNDVEMRYTPSGVPVSSFSVAVSRSWTDAGGNKQQKTVWFRVSAWQKLAEITAQYLKKGSKVQVVGELEEARAFTDRDGNARASLELRASNVTFLDSRDEGGGQPVQQGARPAPAAKNELDEDIPF